MILEGVWLMLLKSTDARDGQVGELQALLAEAPSAKQRSKILAELKTLKAGIQGERDAAYYVDFAYKDSPNYCILHDLRLESHGRVAQIDHLLIHWTLKVFVLESKHFFSGIKITGDGEFLRWDNRLGRYQGIASPIDQTKRHIQVLEDVFAQMSLPTRMGIRINPVFYPLVLVRPMRGPCVHKAWTPVGSSRPIIFRKPSMSYLRVLVWSKSSVSCFGGSPPKHCRPSGGSCWTNTGHGLWNTARNLVCNP